MAQAGNQAKEKFHISGIACMDCARKFEESVREHPKVIMASLNVMTGTLEVGGEISLEEIQRIGKCEGYSVSAMSKETVNAVGIGAARYSMIGSGLALIAAYLSESMNVGAPIYLPLYCGNTGRRLGEFSQGASAVPQGNFKSDNAICMSFTPSNNL